MTKNTMGATAVVLFVATAFAAGGQEQLGRQEAVPEAIVNSPRVQRRVAGQTSHLYVAVEEKGGSDDNPTYRRFRAGEASTARTPASSVLEQAARGVEAHRKGDATIRIVREGGADAAGVRVEIAQRTHDFAFGNVFRPRHYRNEAYRTRFLELFNFIQLLEFNWGQYETEEGKPKLADRREFIDGWCRAHGLTRFYGPMLVWSPQNNSPDRPNIPHWLFRYDRPTQDRLLKERIQREVLAYRDVDILWDVVNEAVHCRRGGDWEKKGYMDEPILRTWMQRGVELVQGPR